MYSLLGSAGNRYIVRKGICRPLRECQHAGQAAAAAADAAANPGVGYLLRGTRQMQHVRPGRLYGPCLLVTLVRR